MNAAPVIMLIAFKRSHGLVSKFFVPVHTSCSLTRLLYIKNVVSEAPAVATSSPAITHPRTGVSFWNCPSGGRNASALCFLGRLRRRTSRKKATTSGRVTRGSSVASGRSFSRSMKARSAPSRRPSRNRPMPNRRKASARWSSLPGTAPSATWRDSSTICCRSPN